MTDNKPDEELVLHSMGYYLRPSNSLKIMGNKKLIFGTLGLFIYCQQFVLVVGALNHYASFSRVELCNGMYGEEASEFYDSALAFSSVYHIIEWARTTVFLTAVLMGVNLIQVYYFLGLNMFFGIFTFIYSILKLTDSDEDCKTNQDTRYVWLLADVIVFWVTFWLFSFPNVILFPIMGKKKLELGMKEPEDDDDEEGDNKDEEKKE